MHRNSHERRRGPYSSRGDGFEREKSVEMRRRSKIEQMANQGSIGGGDDSRAHHRSGPHRVFVGNLNFETGWRELKDYMRTAGDVLHADIIADDRGRSRGYG